MRTAPRRTKSTVLPTLIILAVLSPLTTDLYLPAFPRMAADLGASPADIQWSLSATLLGVALGQLVFGPVSDAIGRRRPLQVAAGLHVAASVGIAAVSSVEWLLVLRLIQGLGAAGVSVLAIAVARDSFEGARLATVLAKLALLSGLAPVVAPALGSLLLRVGDWRGVFVALAVFGVVALVVCAAGLPETMRRAAGARAERGTAVHRYRRVLSDRSVLGAAGIGAMAVAGVFAYVSASSFVFQRTYGLTANHYAIVFAVNAAAFAVGSQVAGRLMVRIGPERLLWWTIPLAGASGAGAMLVATLDGGVVAFTGTMFVFLLAAGGCGPTIQVIALRGHAQQAGTAASVLGCINFGLASLISPLSGLGDDPVLSLGALLVAIACFGLLALRLLVIPGTAHGRAAWGTAAVDPSAPGGGR